MKTEELIDFADRMRRAGGPDRTRLREECDESLAAGEISMDTYAVVYRHLAIHAGLITTKATGRYRVCPLCEAPLDLVELDQVRR